MKIYLFRHGETDWNKERRLQGQSDIPLNAFGRELAIKTAAALKNEHFDRIFSSPLVRAFETAQILAGERGTEIITDVRLCEVNFGDCDGAGFDEMKRDTAHPLHNFFCHPEAYIPPAGAESFEEVTRRGQDFFRERILPLEGECETVLIVAHGAFNRSVLREMKGIPLKDFWQIGLPNCAASILELRDGKLSVVEESTVYYGEPVNGRP